MSITLYSDLAQVRVASPTHSISVCNAPSAVRIELGRAAWLDRDFVLVHVRADADQVLGMPALHKVEQMLPAGWGGAGSVVFEGEA